VNVYYALGGEYLESWYAYREMESRVRKEISAEAVKEIRDGALSAERGPILSVEGGVARIKIEGLLQRRVTASAALLGEAASYEEIEKATLEAASDPDAREIEYHISSPGGNWEGIDYCAEVIASAGKPTKAIVYSEAQSGGYYLASQADKVYAASRGSLFGSVGVAAEMFDRTEEDGRKGVRRLVFTNTRSADKIPDPATDAGAAVVLERLDALYEIFEGRVVEGRRKSVRGFSAGAVRSLNGRSVTARRALELGLIDGVMPEMRKEGRMAPEGEGRMKLKEFAAQGAEAESELEGYAAAKAAEAADAAQERVLKIVRLSGAALSETALEAIKAGVDAGEFARRELIAYREAHSGINAGKLGGIAPDSSLEDLRAASKSGAAAFVL
jgi:ClpP class serine protease